MISFFFKIVDWIRYKYQMSIYKVFIKKYDISSSFRFNGEKIKFYGAGEIIIGENSYIGSYSTIESFSECKVFIGKNCRISHNVRIYTSTNEADQDFNKQILDRRAENVIIEDAVWIGANVFINPGIRIGQNSVIGANSVVTKNVEPNSIVGGVPAKLIRMKSDKIS